REALAVTARLCGPELERYGRCVAASPGSWHRECHRLRDSVTRCASNHPLVRRIRRDCSDSLGAFERCLREHPGNAAECGPRVSAFLLCAESVTAATPGDTPDVPSGATPGANPGG
ncbi:CHCH5 protein, partial [Edolisoma coerulescens]|nr:CHCH5 protein [Edolisoma coerulescens]